MILCLRNITKNFVLLGETTSRCFVWVVVVQRMIGSVKFLGFHFVSSQPVQLKIFLFLLSREESCALLRKKQSIPNWRFQEFRSRLGWGSCSSHALTLLFILIYMQRNDMASHQSCSWPYICPVSVSPVGRSRPWSTASGHCVIAFDSVSVATPPQSGQTDGHGNGLQVSLIQ